jgi:SAM-dependent methyltransferase
MGSVTEQFKSAPFESSRRQYFSSIADPATDAHLNGEYFRKNPTWHVEFSPWKAANIHRLLERKGLYPRTVCEVGCGAGEVLRQLQLMTNSDCRFWGYDVAPAAIEMAKSRENDRLRFQLADFPAIDTPQWDLLLILEVVDHVEDYMGFLRSLRNRAEWKIFSFSLDITVQGSLRRNGLLRRRQAHSHLHHFNKETVLDTLRHTGYKVVDCGYQSVPPAAALAKLVKPIRSLGFTACPDLAVRMFGGYSLMVLAR